MHKDQTEREEKYLTLNLHFDVKTSQLPYHPVLVFRVLPLSLHPGLAKSYYSLVMNF